MYHKISQMCDKIAIVKEKAETLRKMKYTDKAPRAAIDFLIADIQQLCQEIANDKSEYTK